MSVSARRRASRMAPEDRHAQLLPVIEAVFLERGYGAVSMEDLAAAAGVTRPVINRYFGSKDGAFLACVRRAREDFEAGLHERAEGEATLRGRIRAGGEHMFATLERDPARWHLLFSSSAVASQELSAELEELRFATIEQIRLIIAAGAPTAAADGIEACAHAMSGVGERLGRWWQTRPDISRATVVEHFLTIVCAGLSSYIDLDGDARAKA